MPEPPVRTTGISTATIPKGELTTSETVFPFGNVRFGLLEVARTIVFVKLP
jgi:hypothetical protein